MSDYTNAGTVSVETVIGVSRLTVTAHRWKASPEAAQFTGYAYQNVLEVTTLHTERALNGHLALDMVHINSKHEWSEADVQSWSDNLAQKLQDACRCSVPVRWATVRNPNGALVDWWPFTESEPRTFNEHAESPDLERPFTASITTDAGVYVLDWPHDPTKRTTMTEPGGRRRPAFRPTVRAGRMLRWEVDANGSWERRGVVTDIATVYHGERVLAPIDPVAEWAATQPEFAERLRVAGLCPVLGYDENGRGIFGDPYPSREEVLRDAENARAVEVR